ncbi:MAG: chemotaxis protein CheW [Planctomycetota bacterium]
MMKVLFTSVGGRRFALDCGEVREVLPVVEHRPALAGPPWLLGLFNLRGRLAPLVDLGVIVEGAPTRVRMASRIVVVELEADLFSGRPLRVGILVPEILGLGACDFDGEAAHPGFGFVGASHLGPTTTDADGMVQLLRCRRILEGDAALRELPLQEPA